jgi:hypothetical protein
MGEYTDMFRLRGFKIRVINNLAYVRCARAHINKLKP